MSTDQLTPAWAAEVAEDYLTGTLNTFVLTGAVHELQPIDDDGVLRFGSLEEFVVSELLGATDFSFTYNRSAGLRATSPESLKSLQENLSSYDQTFATEFSRVPPRDPGRAFQLMENYVAMQLLDQRSLGMVLNQLEYIAPAGSVNGLSPEDRFSLSTLLRWSANPRFLAGNVTFVGLCADRADLNERLLTSPSVRTITVPLATDELRARFIATLPPIELPMELVLAQTGGLSLLAVQRVLAIMRNRGTVTEYALVELCTRERTK